MFITYNEKIGGMTEGKKEVAITTSSQFVINNSEKLGGIDKDLIFIACVRAEYGKINVNTLQMLFFLLEALRIH